MSSRIVIDENLKEQIANLNDPAELCDSTGQVVAYAVSPSWHRDWIYAWAAMQIPDKPISAIDEFRREGGMSIEDVRGYLKTVAAGEQP